MSSMMSEIYYKPEHLWTGRKAIKLLQKASGLKLKVVKAWLAKQAFGKYIYQLLNILIMHISE